MSPAIKLLPDPRPLRVEQGGAPWIRHLVNLSDYPKECEAPIQVVYDRLMKLNFRDETILPDRITDLVLVQMTGRSPRSVQEVLYWLEIGPTACHRLMALERAIRQTAAELGTLAGIPAPTDEDRARADRLEAQHRSARDELLASRGRRAGLKAELGRVNFRLEVILRKREPSDADRALAGELSRQQDRIRAELMNEDSVIFRHSGPGFHGGRQIELLAQLAGAKRKERGKARPAAEAEAAAEGKGKRKARAEPGQNGAEAKPLTAKQQRAHEANMARAYDDVQLTPEQEADAKKIWDRIAERRAGEQKAGRRPETIPIVPDPDGGCG